MTSAYPGSLDSFNNPTGTTKTDATGYEHATQHANANDAIEAIQAELGTTPSGSYATVKERLDAGISGSLQGAWESGTAYVAGDVVTHNGATWVAIEDNTNVEPTDDSGIITHFDSDQYIVTPQDFGVMTYTNIDTPGLTGVSFDTVDFYFAGSGTTTDTDIVIKQGGVTLATGTFPAGVTAGWKTATLSERITPVNTDDIQWELDRTGAGSYTLQIDSLSVSGARGPFGGSTSSWVMNSDIGGASYYMMRFRLRDVSAADPKWEKLGLTAAPDVSSLLSLSDTDVGSAAVGDYLVLAEAPPAGWTWVGLPDVVTASNYYTHIYDNVWDGTTDTSWNTGGTSPAWTVADFGIPVTASRLGLCSNSVARYWDLFYSHNGTDWTMLLDEVAAPVSTNETMRGFPETTARYWKLTCSNGAWTDPRSFTLYHYVVDDGPKWQPVPPTARETAIYTTESLTDDAEETGTVTLAKGYRLLRIATDVPARLRVYTTAAKRTADATREIGTDPEGDHGVVLDLVTTADLLAADLSPTVDGWNNETAPSTSIPIAVQNLSGATDTVSVTFTFIRTEGSGTHYEAINATFHPFLLGG